MDNPIQVNLGRIAQDLQIRRVQVESVVQLLDEGNTVPFITRYRKERTGNLNEVIIREIQLRVQRLRELAERKETILKAIEAQGKLDPDLAAAIRAADNPKRLEDLYLPFKPKKRTKASDARERGPGAPGLADLDPRRDARPTSTPPPRNSSTPRRASTRSRRSSKGVGHILAEAISEMAMVRDAVRKVVWKTGKIVTAKAEIPDGQGLEYRDYFDYSEPIAQIPPHRVLAINRGDKEGPLKVKLEVSRPDVEAALFSQLPLEGHPHADLFRAAAIDALDRLILPSMEREVRRDLTEAAEKHAVEVFARNLGSLLLQPPIPKQVVLAIDPGFRTGCKVAVLDPGGNLLDQAVIFPHPPQNRRSEAKVTLKDLVGKHKVGVVAIGNGTACRETEELIAEIIAEGTRFSQGDGGIGADRRPRPRRTAPRHPPPEAARSAGDRPARPATEAAAIATEPAGRAPPSRARGGSRRGESGAGRGDDPSRSRAPCAEPAEATDHESRRPHPPSRGRRVGNGRWGMARAPSRMRPSRRGPRSARAAESPVEMLPPISGGAPEGDETEAGEAPDIRAGADSPAGRRHRRHGGVRCRARPTPSRHRRIRTRPHRRANRPRPSPISPCRTTGSRSRSGRAGHRPGSRHRARPGVPRRVHVGRVDRPARRPRADPSTPAATGDHLPVPEIASADADRAVRPGRGRRPTPAARRGDRRGTARPGPAAAAGLRARAKPAGQGRSESSRDAARATASSLAARRRPSRLRSRTRPMPSSPSSPTSSSTRPAPASTRPARSAATSCPSSTPRSASDDLDRPTAPGSAVRAGQDRAAEHRRRTLSARRQPQAAQGDARVGHRELRQLRRRRPEHGQRAAAAARLRA